MFIKNNMYLLYTAMVGAHVVHVLTDLTSLAYVSGILAVVALVFSFPDASRLFQVIGSIFLFVGMFLLIYTGPSWVHLPFFMTSTLSLLAMLYVLPFINSVIVVGGYDKNINTLLKTRVRHLGLLYSRSLFATYILVAFLNITTLPLVHDVLHKNLKHKAKALRDRFISQAALRGFALSLAWSPMEILVAITVDIPRIGYLTYLPWLLLFSVTLLVLESLRGWRYRHIRLDEGKETGRAAPASSEDGKRQSAGQSSSASEPTDAGKQTGAEKQTDAEISPEMDRGTSQTPEPLLKEVLPKIAVMFIALFLFLCSVIAVGNILQVEFLMAVTLVVIPFSLIWAFVIRRWHTYLVFMYQTWKMRTNSLQNFVVLFLSLGFFVSALRESVFLSYLQQPFIALSDQPVLILAMIQLLYFGLAMLGVHPLATIGVLSEALQPLLAVLNPLSVGIVLITGGLATSTVGPYGVSVTMIGQLAEQNPYRITAWNTIFALVYGGLGTLIGTLLL